MKIEIFRQAFERIKRDVRLSVGPVLILVAIWAGISFIFGTFCPVAFVTGFPCPGCGLTRAALSLISLHPVRAWDYNPSLYLWAAMGLAFIVRRYFQGKELSPLRPLFAAVIVATVLIYIWRMIHCFPGSVPMVYTPGNCLENLLPGYGDFCLSRFGGAGSR